jgi:RNA polymerase sigma-70 factor, ECF subfamily
LASAGEVSSKAEFLTHEPFSTVDDLAQTRHSLLLRLRRHDHNAWAEFLAVYEQAIYRYCRSRRLQDADARDATQEVLAAVHARIDRWERDASKGGLRAWLFQVARNISVNRFRERSRRNGAGSNVMQVLAKVPHVDDAEAAAFQREYRRALFGWAAEQVRPEVREKTWRSFWMTAVEGQRPELVAKELKLSVGTVYTAKCRVVARIRAVIARVDDDAENCVIGDVQQALEGVNGNSHP